MASTDYQLSHDAATRFKQVLTITRVITFALFTGLFVITSVFAFLVYGLMGPAIPGGIDLFNAGLPTLTFLGVVILTVAVMASYAVARSMVAAHRRRTAPTPPPLPDRFAPDVNDLTWTAQVPKEQLFSALDLYQTQLITRLALIEGSGVLNAVFFMIEGQPLGLLAVGCALGLITSQFPSPASLSRRLREALDGGPGAR